MQSYDVLANYAHDVAAVSERYANIAAYHVRRGEHGVALQALKTLASINNRLAVYCALRRRK